MKQVNLFLLLFICGACFSQKTIYEVDFLKKRDIIDVLPVFTPSERLFSLVILKKDSIKTILFDSLHHIRKTYAADIMNSQIFEKLVDVSHYGSLVYVIYKNKSIYSSRYGFFMIDYDEDLLLEKEINFKSDKEEYLASHAYDNSLYIVTIKIKTSELFVYRYNRRGELLTKKPLDLSDDNIKGDLYTLIQNENPGDYSVDLININDGNKDVLNTYSSKNKSYVQDGRLNLLISSNYQETILYSIDLINATCEIRHFLIPEILCKPSVYQKNNSLIVDTLLFQFYACARELSLTISDIRTSEIYANYQSSRDDINAFKQGIIIKNEYGDLQLENLDQKEFRKILKGFIESDLFVSINENENNYTFSIGIMDKETYILPIFWFPSFIVVLTIKNTIPVSVFYSISKKDLSIQRANNLDFKMIKETIKSRDCENKYALYNYIFDYNKKDKRIQLLVNE